MDENYIKKLKLSELKSLSSRLELKEFLHFLKKN